MFILGLICTPLPVSHERKVAVVASKGSCAMIGTVVTRRNKVDEKAVKTVAVL